MMLNVLNLFGLMLPEIGHVVLIIGLFVALGMGMGGLKIPHFKIPRLLSQAAPFYKGGDTPNDSSFFSEKNITSINIQSKLTIILFSLIFIAYVILTLSFLQNDFSVLYVAENSSISLPWWYKICAVWGAHEGSMLLWVMILSGWMVAVVVFNRYTSNPLPALILNRVLAVLGWLVFGFLLFILLTSNPFTRLLPNIPTNGNDLNPLLQDIGFLFHPPVLYMGYVGLSIPFALAITALLEGEWNAKWARWARIWTLAAWCFLTVGITLGSWWAYRELGWGGWWFWDPVENASFMPWIVATALLHSLLVTEKRNTFKAWTTLLAIFAFALSLLGTFLVRSGILTSVHAFAVDPSRGLFMLIFLFVVVCIAMILYSWRVMQLRSEETYALLSRETALMLNNVMLLTIMLTILLGTLYPLIIQVLGLGKISVGAPYFNHVFSLLMLPVLFLMGMGPITPWKAFSSTQSDDFKSYLRLSFLLSLTLGLLLPWLIFQTFHPDAAIGIFLSLWVIIATVLSHWKKRHWGMFFAHIGIAVTLIGIVISSSYSIERNVVMSEGDSASLGPYSIIFQKMQTLDGPNYSGLTGIFKLKKENKIIATIRPEKRYYPIQKSVMTDAAIDASIFRDIYIALGERVDHNEKREPDAWIIRLYYKPFIRWIWAGGFLIFVGGLFACWPLMLRKK